ncbi:MAG: hypothetical protein FJW23_02115 [Acidimicrobiia bacterium]|nr:hypothetical protein [Acidimicrobiia bacterium]
MGQTGIDVLLVTVGGRPYAVPVTDVSAIHLNAPVSPCPGPVVALRGLAFLRRAVRPVYDLAWLMGVGPVDGARWVVEAAEAPIAFALDACEGAVPAGPIQPCGDDDRRCSGSLVVAGIARPVIRMTAVLAAVSELVETWRTEREARG